MLITLPIACITLLCLLLLLISWYFNYLVRIPEMHKKKVSSQTGYSGCYNIINISFVTAFKECKRIMYLSETLQEIFQVPIFRTATNHQLSFKVCPPTWQLLHISNKLINQWFYKTDIPHNLVYWLWGNFRKFRGAISAV